MFCLDDFVIRSTKLSGVGTMSVIPISTDLAKPLESAFFRLYLLLKGTSHGETAAFILIAIGLCCVLGVIVYLL